MATINFSTIGASGLPVRSPSTGLTPDFAALRLGADTLQISQGGSGGGAYFDFGAVALRTTFTPADANDLVTKSYADNLAAGLKWKEEVRAIATTNITLENEQTIDGVALVAGDRVAVFGQTNAAENGIYLVVDAGAWTRATDADDGTKIKQAAFFVSEGTTNEDTAWVVTNDGDITIDVTLLTAVQFSGGAGIEAGEGLVKVGSTIDIVAEDDSILVNTDSIQVQLDAVGGIVVNAGEGLGLNTDGSSVELVSNALAVNYTKAFTNDNAGNVAQRTVVYIKADGDVDVAAKDTADLETFALGVVEPAAGIDAAASGRVFVRRGAIIPGFSSLTPGQLYFLDTAGGIALYSAVSWTTGDSVYQVGRAVSATEIEFDPQFLYEY